ncbi:MAG: ABC transporter ATP-binding protein [Puniceicoccales bacterium]|nr:ABC transporter ATP-binding protein [Puniceicoccales bacterium]
MMPPIPEFSQPPPLREPIVRVRELARSFGKVHAVRGISFDILPGQVVGFIGANGAGKTTAMRIMATLDEADSGTVAIKGIDLADDPRAARAHIGWMPDAYGTYANMSVLEYLDFYARACGIRKDVRAGRIADIMAFAELAPIADRMVNKLSKGMGQRVCFGRMLLHDPEFLILDEPAAGLDPKARIEFKNLVRLLVARGKTLFISSHILSELEEMCDSLLFIDSGQLIHHGSAETLKTGTDAQGAASFLVIVSGSPERLVEWTLLQPGWVMQETLRNGARLRCMLTRSEDIAESLRRMVQDGIPVIDFHREERRLEDAFVEIIKSRH